MKRRAFLAGFAAAPWWIRRAFADASVGATAARGRTHRTLVFVVPSDENARWDRAGAFGEYLNHGRDADLAPLALADVVCARAADYGVGGNPILLYIEGSSVRRLDRPLPVGDAARRRLLGDFIREVLPLNGESAPELAGLARARYVIKAPRGARWGHTSMCGATYEEGPADNVDCGMGSVDEPSRRFLDFYTGSRK
jgi:hypothetical protein